jgi:hypothetical protein
VTLRNLGRAILDGRSISGAQTLRIECGGGIPDDPKDCFYFEIQGTLFVNANTSAAAAGSTSTFLGRTIRRRSKA